MYTICIMITKDNMRGGFLPDVRSHIIICVLYKERFYNHCKMHTLLLLLLLYENVQRATVQVDNDCNSLYALSPHVGQIIENIILSTQIIGILCMKMIRHFIFYNLIHTFAILI